MNSSGQKPGFKELISQEYSGRQSWFELKQTVADSHYSIPLFTKFVLLTRIILYVVSWVTSAANNFINNDPELTFGSYQIWRLFLCPYLVTSLFFDLLLIMPLYLCFFLFTRENHHGTIAAWAYFNSINVVLQLLSYAICVLVGKLRKEDPGDLLSQDAAFFNIFVTELIQAMLRNPNKQIDILCATVAQKYFILISLVLASIVLPYDWISIAAVLILSAFLYLTRSMTIFNSCVQALEKIFRCDKACSSNGFLGYVTAKTGSQNARMSSDDLVPFNRRVVRGRVQTNPAYKELLKLHQAESSLGLGASKSGSNGPEMAFSSPRNMGSASSSGQALGGSVGNRKESKLLQMRKAPETPEKGHERKQADHSMDEDELLEDENPFKS